MTQATRDPIGCICHRAGGVIELPPKEERGTMPEKVQGGLLRALRDGYVVTIFPEGEIWKRKQPPLGDSAPGVIYPQRHSGAAIVPMAVWTGRRSWSRRRSIIEVGSPAVVPTSLDLDGGANWLRQCALELYDRARRRGARRP